MNPSIGKEMVKYPYVAYPTMPIEGALVYMQECHIRHLPVFSDEGLVGLVSERDILSYRGLNKADELTVGDIMSRQPYVVNEHASTRQVVGHMAAKKIGSALVTDSENHLIGIFTTIDALYLLEKLLDKEPEKMGRIGSFVTVVKIA